MKNTKLLTQTTAILVIALASSAHAQGPGGPPPDRNHTANKTRPLNLVPADQEPPAERKVTITVEGDQRIIRSNAMPGHLIGKFPNSENPNTASEQEVEIRLPLTPKANEKSVSARPVAGVFLNGVFIEAGTGEFWTGDGSRPWNYDALGNAVAFGLDAHHAHVQPTGKYHYHGHPTGFLKEVGVTSEKHSPLVGWALDGFPIYALYGYSDPKDPGSEIKEMTSSYKLKEGNRPTPPEGPGGSYDGAFTDDYEYVKGLGTLDECNGCFTVTPDFPKGTYAYFLSNTYPVILRDFRGTSAMGGPGGKPENGSQGSPDGKDLIKHLDKDGDGKVSKKEFDGPGEHFTHIDKNKDGQIDADEAKSGPPKGEKPPRK